MSAQAQTSLLTKKNLNPRRRHILTVLRSRSERHATIDMFDGERDSEPTSIPGLKMRGVLARCAAIDAAREALDTEIAAIEAEYASEEAEEAALRDWYDAAVFRATVITEEDDAEERSYEVIVDLANMTESPLDYEGWYGFHTFTPR